MNVHQVLVDTRNLLEHEGWLQGGLGAQHDETGPRCILGGMSSAVSRNAPVRSAVDFKAACKVLAERLGLPAYPTLSIWNDELGRTKDEVLAALDEAIAKTAPSPFTGVSIETETVGV